VCPYSAGRPPLSPPFPSTTLFRSACVVEYRGDQQVEARCDVGELEPLAAAAVALPPPEVPREDRRVPGRVGEELLRLAHRAGGQTNIASTRSRGAAPSVSSFVSGATIAAGQAS